MHKCFTLAKTNFITVINYSVLLSFILFNFLLLSVEYANAITTPRLEQLDKTTTHSAASSNNLGIAVQKLSCADLSGHITEITLSLSGIGNNVRLGFIDRKYTF